MNEISSVANRLRAAQGGSHAAEVTKEGREVLPRLVGLEETANTTSTPPDTTPAMAVTDSSGCVVEQDSEAACAPRMRWVVQGFGLSVG